MSNLRSKASEIRARGEAERGNFEPSGVPLRMYNYWLYNSESRSAGSLRNGKRENFCHYWRVVAIWAPLLYLMDNIVFRTSTAIVLGVLALVALVVAAFTYSSVLSFLGILALGMVVAVSGVLGLLSGISLGAFDSDEDRRYYDVFLKKTALWALLIGFPLGLPVLVLVKAGRWFLNSDNSPEILMGLFILAALAGATALVVSEGWLMLLAVVGILGGAVISLLVFVLGLSRLADYVSGRRIIRRERFRALEEEQIRKGGKSLESKEPGRVSKFFSGLGDFLIFTFQIARVNKWKICPLVDVDKNKR